MKLKVWDYDKHYSYKPHRWFAWHPVKARDEHVDTYIVWLEHVNRVRYHSLDNPDYWHYELLDKATPREES